jgi:hypothetical protein
VARAVVDAPAVTEPDEHEQTRLERQIAEHVAALPELEAEWQEGREARNAAIDAELWQEEREARNADADAKAWQRERDERLIAEHDAALRELERQPEPSARRTRAVRPRARRRGAGRPAAAAARRSSPSGDDPDSDPEPGADVERDGRVALFAVLADGEHWLELRSRRPDGTWRKDWAPTPERADELARRRILEGCDAYVGMLPRLGRRGDPSREYAPARALWADCDAARAVRKLELFEPEPTAIVASGGVDGDTPKLHAYWTLTPPLAAAEVRRHALRLAHHLEADLGACDAGRILRVPGSCHHATGRVAELVRFTGEAHTLDELTGDLPDAPAWRAPDRARPAKTTDELVALFRGHYTHEHGGRHDPYRSVCGVLLRYCDRLPPDVLLELAVAWAQAHTSPCKPRAELERNFDNVLARERARRGIA